VTAAFGYFNSNSSAVISEKTPEMTKSDRKPKFSVAFLNVPLTPERETLADFDVFNNDFFVFKD
jgi:hypothetical protein